MSIYLNILNIITMQAIFTFLLTLGISLPALANISSFLQSTSHYDPSLPRCHPESTDYWPSLQLFQLKRVFGSTLGTVQQASTVSCSIQHHTLRQYIERDLQPTNVNLRPLAFLNR
ncbi:hypothetical protein BJ508DRAFT_117769 [Ascobolus immersus RN42]|uniref:Uncharacterized protein n=1 Tax=Ascobolus immersus RN42 TaxID=1160509 RepID=A0A3N4I4L5_ASCIM|nr:hypothetical protein BJ508DRAFT_117769 [Ascobolus immersus RN42]